MEPEVLLVWKFALTALIGIGAITATLGSVWLLLRLLDKTVERGLQLWALCRKLPHTTRRLIETVNEVRLLRTKLEECKRDAERYRWIRGNVPSHSTRWSRWKVEYFYGASGWNDLRHAKLDAEIDAALAAKGNE